MTVQASLEIVKNQQTVQAGYTVTTNLGFPKGRLTERFLALKYFYTDKPGSGNITPRNTTINYDMFEGTLNPFYNGLVIGIPAEKKVSANPLLEAYHIGTGGIQSLVELSKATLNQINTYEGVMNKDETVRTWDMQGVRNHLVMDYPTNVGNGIEVNEFVFIPDGPRAFFTYGVLVRTVDTLFIDTWSNMPSDVNLFAFNESAGEFMYYSNNNEWLYVKNGKLLKMNFDGFIPDRRYDTLTVIDNTFVFTRIGYPINILEFYFLTSIIDNGDGTCTCFTTKKTIELPRNFYLSSREYRNIFEWDDELYILQVFDRSSYSPYPAKIAIYRIKKDLSEILYENVLEFSSLPSHLYLEGSLFYDPAFPNQVIINRHRLEKNTLKLTPFYIQNTLSGDDKMGLYQRHPNSSRAYGFSYLGNGIYSLGFVEVEDPVVSFKLDNPIIKTPDETMKLVFDINIYNEDYYDEMM